MGLDFSLELVTTIKPLQALQMVASILPDLTWGEQQGGLYDEDITIDATEPLAFSKDRIQRAFGFSPDLSMGFRFASNRDYERFKLAMLKAAMLLLPHARFGVLLFNDEIIVLQKTTEGLVLNADYHIWDDDQWLMEHAQMVFARRPLPSPLL
jgi:hypothetical protein